MKLQNKKPLIFIIAGKARTGKNTVADIIVNYYNNSIQLSYTKYLKDYACMISSWDRKEETKPRLLLQTLGTEIIKNKIDNKLLIRRIIEDIKVLSYFKEIIVISGARRKDEIDDIKNSFNNVVALKINKSNISKKLTEKENKHITETDLDDYNKFDYVIENNSTKKELKSKTELILGDYKYGK